MSLEQPRGGAGHRPAFSWGSRRHGRGQLGLRRLELHHELASHKTRANDAECDPLGGHLHGHGGALLDAEACAAAGALLARRPYVPLGSCLTPASEAAGVLGTYPSRATTAAL